MLVQTETLFVQECSRAECNEFMLKPQQLVVEEAGDVLRADAEELVFAELPYGFNKARVNDPAIFDGRGTFGKISTFHGLCRKETVQCLYPGGVFCETDILLLSFCISEVNPIDGHYAFIATVPLEFRKAGGVVDVRQCKSAYAPLYSLFYELCWREHTVAHAIICMTVEEHGVAVVVSKLRFCAIK